MSELTTLPNIGKVLEQQLLQVGIETPEQLRHTGSSRHGWTFGQSTPPPATAVYPHWREQFRAFDGTSSMQKQSKV